MKKYALAALAAVMVLTSAALAGDAVITKEGKTSVVNTTTLTKNVRGFRGPTPLKIYIKSGKIQKIEPLKNQEGPQYFAKAKTLLSNYEGKSVNKAANMKVDAVSGATFTSKALIKNVQEGVKYYKQHK